MDVFRDFVDRNELIDVPLIGVRFTWSKFQYRSALSKLDRFLVSTDWDDYFSPLSALVFPRPRFDHIPIILKGGEEIRRAGLYPFRFHDMWLLQPSFVDLIRGWWEEMEVWGPLGQRFRLKLRGICEKLRGWNMDVFGDIVKRKGSCLEEIQKWDRLEEETELNEENMMARKKMQNWSLIGFLRWKR